MFGVITIVIWVTVLPAFAFVPTFRYPH